MIRTKRLNRTLQITITGHIRLPLAYELTEALLGVAESCSEYRLDLRAVTDISDGGLAVLAMFTSCACRRGRGVRLAGISTALARRLATLPALQRLLAPQYAIVSDIGPAISFEHQFRDTRRTPRSSDRGDPTTVDDAAIAPLPRRQGKLH